MDSVRLTDVWYFAGVVAADGCLHRDGRHLDVTSKDREWLVELARDLGFTNRVTRKGRSNAWHVQLSSRDLWNWLASIGLTPAKSLTLGPLKIPRVYLRDFVRGVIDGDGCIRSWIHPSNGKTQWSVRVTSGSEAFAQWLKSEISAQFSIHGRIHRSERKPNPIFVVKYGKIAGQALLSNCYYKDCLVLPRKRDLARRFVADASRWSKSGTIGQVAKLANAADSIMGLPEGDFGVINPSNSGKAKA